MSPIFTVMRFIYFTFFYLLYSTLITVRAQEPAPDKDLIFKAASDIINRVPYCALITLDETGQPQARTMEPFQPDENLTIWFGTNRKSRKVTEIKNDSRVTVYYGEDSGNGYVVITGKAVLVDDAKEKETRWKEKWSQFYPDRSNYVLIKVIPETLEVVSYEHGLTGDTITWRAPHVHLTD